MNTNHLNGTKAKRARALYDAPFRRAAVEHYEHNGHTLNACAQELGVNYWTLRDWVKQSHRAAAPSAKGHMPAGFEEENRRLKQALQEVIEQRETLKRTLAILLTA